MKLVALLASVLLLAGSANDPGVERGGAASLVRTHALKINVDDVEKAVSFYTGKLGFEVEDRGADYAVLKSGGREKLILNRVSKLGTPGPKDSQLSFTLQVNDLDQTIERMKALGVEFAEKGPRREGVGNAISIRDPFGRRISLMHQTVVKVEPFREPRLYNFGFLVPDMQAGRDFYSGKLGFVVRSEKYLPLDLPLGHGDKSFAFMLHYRPGVARVRGDYPRAAAFNTLVFETEDLRAASAELTARGVKFLDREPRRTARGRYLAFEDPFGNVSELLEVAGRPPAGD